MEWEQLPLTSPSCRPSASALPRFWGIGYKLDKALGLAGGKQGAVELLSMESHRQEGSLLPALPSHPCSFLSAGAVTRCRLLFG